MDSSLKTDPLTHIKHTDLESWPLTKKPHEPRSVYASANSFQERKHVIPYFYTQQLGGTPLCGGIAYRVMVTYSATCRFVLIDAKVSKRKGIESSCAAACCLKNYRYKLVLSFSLSRERARQECSLYICY